MTKVDKRTLKRVFRRELEFILNGKISHVKYGTWEGDETVLEWADLASFRLNGKEIHTTQNDNCSVDFEINEESYNVSSLAVILSFNLKCSLCLNKIYNDSLFLFINNL